MSPKQLIEDLDCLPGRIIIIIMIIIIHLLGVAPAGYLTAPDNGPEGRLRGGASQL
jgi:hypothetical protein